ncbi:MAG: 4-hydroxy-3-methylbut-2-enyl diphosphate reductase [Prevotella sp.]|nr:4-hydroxy-3-methylbut-2-enyl diphosphate reductase [Prevotella sp.]MCM1474762.1 4-hydroxy-3-methylbut-2-enyl diphosphate reductase [Muribaculaceae bacterium]
MPNIEIDTGSGFCFGVVTAIRKAEEELDNSGSLFCLGDIVHNAAEVERLKQKGLVTITHADLESLHDVKVLLRAHGEPPSTYEIARRNNIQIIDATCPVVLQLQRRIKTAAEVIDSESAPGDSLPPLILIYGKPGHAEVNGLVGQTAGKAVVIQDVSELENLDLNRDILLYSQTTKSLDGFHQIVEAIKNKDRVGKFQWFDTICRQVSNRMQKIRDFARSHDVVIFVSGEKSSNGKVLFGECLSVNSNTHLISTPSQLNPEWLKDAQSIGICGATSTPHWLMKQVADSLTQ